MKNITARKITLFSIALFASIMLLVGLAFNIINFDLGTSGSASTALKEAGYSATGFSMLSFEFPAALRTAIVSIMRKDFCNAFEILSSISSILILVVSILSIVGVVLSFFFMERAKSEKLLKAIIIVSFIMAIVHFVISIVFSSIVQGEYVDQTKNVLGSFNTTTYIALIFQGVSFIAYFVCKANLKEKTSVNNVLNKTREDKKNVSIEEVVEAESVSVMLLKEYKALYDESLISSADYIEKKAAIIKFSDSKIKSVLTALVKNSTIKDIMNAEISLTKLLKEYKQLLEKDVISTVEYNEKKAFLLTCIIV